MKIVISKCFGGFSLSTEGFELLLNLKGIAYEKKDRELDADSLIKTDFYEVGHAGDPEHYILEYDYFYDRSDPDLIAVVEKLGDKANGFAAELKIVEIPDGVEYIVQEYDGIEWIAEKHRVWT